MKGLVSSRDFEKLDLRIGKIMEVKPLSEKLYKLQIGIGKQVKQSIASLRKHYTAGELKGKKVVVVANLKPRKIKGICSELMLLAADSEKPILIEPGENVEAGTKVT